MQVGLHIVAAAQHKTSWVRLVLALAEFRRFQKFADLSGDQVAHPGSGYRPFSPRQFGCADAALQYFFNRGLEDGRDVLHAEGISKHQSGGSDGGDGVGAIASGDVGRASVYRLIESRALTQAGARE